MGAGPEDPGDRREDERRLHRVEEIEAAGADDLRAEARPKPIPGGIPRRSAALIVPSEPADRVEAATRSTTRSLDCRRRCVGRGEPSPRTSSPASISPDSMRSSRAADSAGTNRGTAPPRRSSFVAETRTAGSSRPWTPMRVPSSRRPATSARPSMRRSISRMSGSTALPAAVSRMRRRLRSKRRTPRCLSRSATPREIGGCASESSSAARVKLSCSATARNISRLLRRFTDRSPPGCISESA